MIATCLAIAIGAYLWFLFGTRLRQRWGYLPPWGRIGRYRRWLVRSWLCFGATALAGLVLFDALRAVFRLPVAFAAPALAVRGALGFGWTPAALLATVVIGFGAGAAAGVAVAWLRARRGRRDWIIGRIDRLMPQQRGEIGHAAALAVTAGLVEELFFRLFLPLLLTLATGDAWAGFGVSLLLFAGAHHYQGWAGVAASLLLGAIMSALYLLAGALWVAMLAHALVNLNGLVLRPLAGRRLRRVVD